MIRLPSGLPWIDWCSTSRKHRRFYYPPVIMEWFLGWMSVILTSRAPNMSEILAWSLTVDWHGVTMLVSFVKEFLCILSGEWQTQHLFGYVEDLYSFYYYLTSWMEGSSTMASTAFLSTGGLLVAFNVCIRYVYDLGHRDHVSERAVEVLGLSLPNYQTVRYLRFVHRVLISGSPICMAELITPGPSLKSRSLVCPRYQTGHRSR